MHLFNSSCSKWYFNKNTYSYTKAKPTIRIMGVPIYSIFTLTQKLKYFYYIIHFIHFIIIHKKNKTLGIYMFFGFKY